MVFFNVQNSKLHDRVRNCTKNGLELFPVMVKPGIYVDWDNVKWSKKTRGCKRANEACLPCRPFTHLHSRLPLAQATMTLITRFMGPTWGPSGADRTRVGPMLAPWTLGILWTNHLTQTIHLKRWFEILGANQNDGNSPFILINVSCRKRAELKTFRWIFSHSTFFYQNYYQIWYIKWYKC